MSNFDIPVITMPNLVFFSSTVVPLYIVDSRYIQMVRDAESERGLIALSLAQEVYAESSAVSLAPKKICTAAHPSILKEYEDGSIKVLMKGVCKVEISKVSQDIPYPVYQARIVEQLGLSNTSFIDGELERIGSILKNWLEKNIKDSVERDIFEQSLKSIYESIDYTCMFLIKDLEIKQILLEADTFEARVKLLSTLLKGDIPLKEDFIVSHALKNYQQLDQQDPIAMNH